MTTGTSEAAVTESYTWDAVAGVPLLLTDSDHAFVYGVGTTPLAQVGLGDGAVDFLHGDLIGSVLATTAGSGAVTCEVDYDEYGLVRVVTGQASCSGVTRFGYAGEYTDPTGYVYLRARYYDPATAQFLTRDPLADYTGNPYGYTDGNPLQFVDPLGLDWDWQTDLRAAATTVMMLNPVGIVLGIGDWDDANGENIAVNALQSYGAGVLDGLGRMANTGVNYSPVGMAAQSMGWSGLNLGFGDPNRCNSIYGWFRGIGQWTVRANATLATSGRNLARSLASAQQLGEQGAAISGAGTNTALRAAERLAATYGGAPSAWAKMTSSLYRGADGFAFETHWYQNVATGFRVEAKTVFR